MNCAAPSLPDPDAPVSGSQRHWPASLQLQLGVRQGKTRLIRTLHEGPLRVQRPFYPEATDCCHVYLLHPPGGMVIGDRLSIEVAVAPGASSLLTTPSAGKIYGAKGAAQEQSQRVQLSVAADACLEWLPQETIVFDTANGRLETRVDLEPGARYAGWDIVRLGRAASGERFTRGQCLQSLEIWRGQQPLLIERNRIAAGGPLQANIWGLQNRNTFATFVATVSPDRELIDELAGRLDQLDTGAGDCWGITQKEDLLVTRYLGDDVALCRAGFELVWRQIREQFNGRPPVAPRIWNT